MQRIIIRHISGSRVNQVDEFLIDQFKVLTLGRDPDQTIRYDSETDDLVGRQHARISLVEDHADRFVITDLNSRNGTYVNKQRISGTVSIQPGDEVQLGPGGPAFRFDLAPSPDGILLPTREANYVRETREPVPRPDQVGTLTKAPVGRATVERILDQYRQSSRDVLDRYQQSAHRNLINLAAALVGVIVLVAGGLLYAYFATTKPMGEKIDEITQKMVSFKPMATSSDPIKTPAEIAKAFGPATVFVEGRWRLIDLESNRQVYHHYVKEYPAYIRVAGKILPWLSLDDDNKSNHPVGTGSQGSGFAVTDYGFVLTTRHVVRPWYTRYQLPDKPSVIFDVDPKTERVQYNVNATPYTGDKLRDLQRQMQGWIPAYADRLVNKRRNSYYAVPNRRFGGRFESVRVTFPNDKLYMEARVVRISEQHDVALLKVDTPYRVPTVTIPSNYGESRPGDKVIVLGYPSVSPDPTVFTKSYDPLNPGSLQQKVRSVTITDGLIGKVIRGKVKPEGGEYSQYSSEFGDVLQLTLIAGTGNSGGPVFNDRGDVIGIFAYGRQMDVEITFAVPMRFGEEIMRIKPVFEDEKK